MSVSGKGRGGRLLKGTQRKGRRQGEGEGEGRGKERERKGECFGHHHPSVPRRDGYAELSRIPKFWEFKILVI